MSCWGRSGNSNSSFSKARSVGVSHSYEACAPLVTVEGVVSMLEHMCLTL